MQDISYFTLAIASFIFAISPGPGVLAVLATSISRGIPTALVLTLGEVTGDMIYLLVAMLSLASLSSGLNDAMLVVRILGAIYLFWIGVESFRSPPIKQEANPVTARNLGIAFIAGFMISMTNPKVIVFYLSFLPLFIDLAALDIKGGATVMAVMFTSVYLGPALIAIFGRRAAALAMGERSGRIMNKVTGIMLMMVSLSLILSIWL